MTEIADTGCDADDERRASDGRGFSRESSTSVPGEHDTKGQDAQRKGKTEWALVLCGGGHEHSPSTYLRLRVC